MTAAHTASNGEAGTTCTIKCGQLLTLEVEPEACCMDHVVN